METKLNTQLDPRHVIQITSYGGEDSLLVVLCNDGTMWERVGVAAGPKWAWKQILPVPSH